MLAMCTDQQVECQITLVTIFCSQIWQCGGRLVQVPCSHVGYVYDQQVECQTTLVTIFCSQIWHCGGRLVQVPCSHVGHVYRSAGRALWSGYSHDLHRNLARVAEVWLDEYKAIFYEQTGLRSVSD